MMHRLTIQQAAGAADVTAPALRHWLQPAGPVALLHEPPRSGRTARLIGPADLARLAIVAALIRNGLTTAEAADVLARSVDPLLRPAVSWPDVREMLGGAVLVVSREPPDGLAVSIADRGGRLFGAAGHGPARLQIGLVECARDAEIRLRDSLPNSAKEIAE